MMHDVRNELLSCIDHLDFTAAGVNSLEVDLDRPVPAPPPKREVSEEEHVLLAELLLCGSDAYRSESTTSPRHGIPLPLAAIFRQANLILAYLHSIRRITNLIQYAFADHGADDPNVYVPDASGFQIASSDTKETLVIVEYGLASALSNDELHTIYQCTQGHEAGVNLKGFVEADGRLVVQGPTWSALINEALYQVRSETRSPTPTFEQMLTRRLCCEWKEAGGA